MGFSLAEILRQRQGENYALHDAMLNSQYVKVLRTIGFDRVYTRAEGPYLFDKEGHKYLDLLSGFGVYALGRNHPAIVKALHETLDAGLPNLVQMDCSLLSGLFAEKLKTYMPDSIDRLFFCNSGTEAVEAAIKFARATTKRPKIVFCDHAFHGLTMGALSLNGDKIFKEGFGPLLADAVCVPFNDLPALQKALAAKDVAAFIVEPIQGKGVNIPDDNYLRDAAEVCRKQGTLFVADEIQTGVGRTGKFLAIEHWGVEPDMILMAKALSGGFVPVGVVACRQQIFDKVFNRMDKAVVHGSTFAKNNLAMAAGLATLHALEEEKILENAAHRGEQILQGFRAMVERHDFVKEVRGKGLMIGIEFGSPKSLKLKASWAMLDAANKGLFCQMVTIPLLKEHRILSQVSGHASYTVKLIPPLTLSQGDVDWVLNSFDEVIGNTHRGGAIWDLASTLAGHALKGRSAEV